MEVHIPIHTIWKLLCFQVTNLKVTGLLSVITLSNSQHLKVDDLPLPLVDFCPQGAYQLMKKTKQQQQQNKLKHKRLSAGASVSTIYGRLQKHLAQREKRQDSFLEQGSQA